METLFTTVKPKSTPWYREPWVWLVIAGPAIVIVAGIITTFIAFSGADKVIAPDYYKRGLAINKDIRRDMVAQERGLTADMKIDEATDAISLQVRGQGELPTALMMQVFRAVGNGNDEIILTAQLVQAEPGLYRGKLVLPENPAAREPALWQVNLESTDWRLSSGWYGLIHDAVAIKAAG